MIFTCPPPPRRVLPLATDLDLGFGIARAKHRVSRAQRWTHVWGYVRRYDERGPSPTLRTLERRARREGGYWRLTLDTPLASDVYERTDRGEWVHVARGLGFA